MGLAVNCRLKKIVPFGISRGGLEKIFIALSLMPCHLSGSRLMKAAEMI